MEIRKPERPIEEMTEKEQLEEAIENTRKTMFYVLWHYMSEDEFISFIRELAINGKISPESPIYTKAYDLNLIKEDGALWDFEHTKIVCSAIALERSRQPPKAEKKGAKQK